MDIDQNIVHSGRIALEIFFLIGTIHTGFQDARPDHDYGCLWMLQTADSVKMSMLDLGLESHHVRDCRRVGQAWLGSLESSNNPDLRRTIECQRHEVRNTTDFVHSYHSSERATIHLSLSSPAAIGLHAFIAMDRRDRDDRDRDRRFVAPKPVDTYAALHSSWNRPRSHFLHAANAN